MTPDPYYYGRISQSPVCQAIGDDLMGMSHFEAEWTTKHNADPKNIY